MHTGVSLFFLVIVCLTLIGIFLLLFYYLFLYYLEALWYRLFGRPAFVHLYIFKKRLSAKAEATLQQFSYYSNLTAKQQGYFRHRVAKFISKYEFHEREGAFANEELKVQIAAVWVQLTFGLRMYLTDVFRHIIIYPDTYVSNFTGLAHKGEYNHPAGAVVFSQRHFKEGLGFGTNKINTALHEFAHVIQAATTTTDDLGAGGDVYAKYFDEVLMLISTEEMQNQLTQMDFFSRFSFKHTHELMAAVLEGFYETPDDFQKTVPVLYDLIKKMLNYNLHIFNTHGFVPRQHFMLTEEKEA